MPKYAVKQNIKHDGADYVDGDSIELSAVEAKPLLEIGALAKPVKAKPAKPVKAKPAKPVKAKPAKPVKAKPAKPADKPAST